MTSRNLLSLPAIVHQAQRWRLPLCDATALALLEALSDNSDDSRTNRLNAALLTDPALAIWAVWQVVQQQSTGVIGQHSSADFPDSVSRLAAWLSSRLLQLLDWSGATTSIELSSEQQGKYAALVAESIGAAQTAWRLTGRNDSAAEPSYLAALTARWQEWLKAAEISASLTDSWPTWPLAATTIDTSSTTEVRIAIDEAWRRWLLEIPGPFNLLPALMGQLRRLADLELNFQQRLQTARLDGLKEFAYGAGHELNNPLANIASRAQTLLKEETHPERRRRLAAINTQAFRAHEMLADMMLFAHPPQPVRKQVDITALVREVLRELEEQAAAQQTTLHPPTRIEPLHIEADAVQLRLALRALCRNSLEALCQGGQVTIEICRCDVPTEASAPAGNAVQILVTDDGPGIEPQILEKIFDPFFSGREAGRGLGFGLCKCWRIAKLHGGHVDVHSSPGQGATFTMTLPETNHSN